MGQAASNPKFFSLRFRPWGLVTASGAVVSAMSFLSLFGNAWWLLDLFSHFRVQSFLGLLILALLLLSFRRFIACGFFGLFAAINFCTIIPFYFGKEPQPAVVSRSYRSLLMNVNTETGSPEKVGAAIRDIDPDFLVLEEVSKHWLSALAVSLHTYPYFEAAPSEDNFGVALYSKYPFSQSRILYSEEIQIPSVIAEVQLPDGRLTLIATHPLPPSSARNSQLRNDHLAQFPPIIKQAASPILFLGDLNATPWSAPFKKLLRDSSLRDSSQGRGILPSWPVYCPLLLIPIDHCLHSPAIHVTKKALGPDVGSDHYPLLIEFVVVPPSP